MSGGFKKRKEKKRRPVTSLAYCLQMNAAIIVHDEPLEHTHLQCVSYTHHLHIYVTFSRVPGHVTVVFVL